MKIDFTQFQNPLDALNLSDWNRNDSLDLSPEDAALAGLKTNKVDSEYTISSTQVQFTFTPKHKIAFHASTVVADIRSNDSLRSIRIRSDPLGAKQIYNLAKEIIDDWDLHCFEETDDLADENTKPVKIDANDELKKWRENPRDCLPSFFAQSETNPHDGLWFFRLVINPLSDSNSLFDVSAQVFWRDLEYDRMNRDDTFWERANSVIQLANDQAKDQAISRVAKSLLYAAARYSAFEFWIGFDDVDSFKRSQDEAISKCLDRFETMLADNFQDHLENFDQPKGGE